MYSEIERYQLLEQIVTFTKNSQEFSCLLQIGSGAEGFTDIYSDIDLMAGCADDNAAEQANIKLERFFRSKEPSISTIENGLPQFSASPLILKTD